MSFFRRAGRADDLPIYEGPNGPLVNEVIELAYSHQLLAGSATPAGCRMHEGDDPELVLEIRSGQSLASFFRTAESQGTFPDHQPGGTEEDEAAADVDGLLWQDLISERTANCIYTGSWWNWEKQNKAAMEALYVAFDHDASRDGEFSSTGVAERLQRTFEARRQVVSPPSIWQDIVLQMFADLHLCAENRAFNGSRACFWEELFAIYKAGCWPFGWDGTWPDSGRYRVWSLAMSQSQT